VIVQEFGNPSGDVGLMIFAVVGTLIGLGIGISLVQAYREEDR
jgi:hypothetical protein